MPGPEVAVIDFLPAKEAPTVAPTPLISSSAWSTTPPYFRQLAGEDLHHLGGGGDGIAAEELAAGEDGCRGAHLVAVAEQLRRGGGRPGQRSRHRERMRGGVGDASSERFLVGLEEPLPLLGELLVEPAFERLLRDAEPAREHAEHHAGLRPVGAGGRLRELVERDTEDLARHLAGRCEVRGRWPGLRLVDEHRVRANGELGAEAPEVLPVEHHGHVQHAARVQHLAGGEANPARGLPPANLRAEAFCHQGVEALRRRRAEQRLSRAHHAVSARTGQSDDKILQHLRPRGVGC